MRLVVALASGVMFALGLIVSEMVNPAKVLAFLDFSGRWDPTLVLVFLGGLAVAVPGMQWVLRQGRPVLAEKFSLPESSEIDWQLVAGAALFGAGWGLAGFCPGPAVTALGSGVPMVFVFVLAMIAGMAAYKILNRWRQGPIDG